MVKCPSGLKFLTRKLLQAYLFKRADRHMIPAVDNTNVDRSVATLHATILGCLRRMSQVSALPALWTTPAERATLPCPLSRTQAA